MYGIGKQSTFNPIPQDNDCCCGNYRKEGSFMVEVYYKLIKEGLRTLESIKDPQIREAVKDKLESEE